MSTSPKSHPKAKAEKAAKAGKSPGKAPGRAPGPAAAEPADDVGSSAVGRATGGANQVAAKATGPSRADATQLRVVNNALVDHHYLSASEFAEVAETLQRNLATTISLYLKFKKFHWDIRGRFFRDLHLAYDEFIDEIFPGIDEIAERLVALGGSPIAAPADIARYSVVTVPSETVRDARTQVAALVADLTRVGKGFRDDSQTVDDANDPATADIYNGYAGKVDKIRWMLQAIIDDDQMS